MTDDVVDVTGGWGTGQQVLSPAQYADRLGKSLRTVQRWLADGEVPGATQDADGRWWIPAGAQRARGAQPTAAVVPMTSSDVVATSSDVVTTPGAPRGIQARTGHLETLDDVAAAMGTNVPGVRRMADDGLLRVGPWGPYGAARVYLPPQD